MAGNQCNEWYLNQKEIPVTGYKASAHGVEYQKKITLLCLLRLLSKKCDFRILAESKECKAFDDLFYQNWLDDGKKWNCNIVQIKHKINENDSITKKDLFYERGSHGDFYLPKYFDSYLQIKSKIKTHSHFSLLYNNELCNLILYTNRTMDETLLKECSNIGNIDEEPILSKEIVASGKRFNESFLLENFWRFEQCSSHFELVRILSNCILTGEIDLKDKMNVPMNVYIYPLFTSVFENSSNDEPDRVKVQFINGTMKYNKYSDLGDKRENIEGYKFSNTFLLAEMETNLTLFRNSLLKEYFFKKEINNLTFNLGDCCYIHTFPENDDDINNLTEELLRAIKHKENFSNIKQYDLKQIIKIINNKESNFCPDFVDGGIKNKNVIKFRKCFINKLLDEREFTVSDIIVKPKGSLPDILKQLPKDEPITLDVKQKFIELIFSGLENQKEIIDLNDLKIDNLIPSIIVKRNNRLRLSSKLLCIHDNTVPKWLKEFKNTFWDMFQFSIENIHNLEFEHKCMPKFSEEEIMNKIPDPPCKEDLREFGHKLKLYLKCPNLEAIGKIIKGEIEERFKAMDTSLYEEHLTCFINDFINGNGKHILTKDEGEKLLYEQEGRFYTRISENECTNAKYYHLKFTPNKSITYFLENTEKPILYVRSKNCNLGKVRILQTLQEFKPYLSKLWCLTLQQIKTEDIVEIMNTYINYQNSELLLITMQFGKSLKNENLWNDIKQKLNTKSKKIIVFIIHENDMEKVVNISTNFSDLEEEFGKKLLKDLNVKFQGSEIKFYNILGQPDKSLKNLDDIITPDVMEVDNFNLEIAPETKPVFIDIIWSAEKKYFENPNFLQINPVIICGEAGTGKSMLFKKIAKRIKQEHPEEWVVTIKCKNFNDTQTRTRDFNTIIECTNLSNRDKALLKLCYKNKCKIHLFIDELSESKCWEKIMEIIQKLSKEVNLKIYIAIRPYLKKKIMEHNSWITETFEYENNLSSEERIQFLNEYWQTKNHNFGNIDSERKAKNLIDLFEMNIADNKFLGNLLHLKVLANHTEMEINHNGTTIYKVHEEVINKKLNSIKFEKLNLSQIHIDLGLEVICPTKTQNNRNHTWEILSVGIVSEFSNSDFKFSHNSIAEYFIAECIKQYFLNGKEELKEVFSSIIFMDGYETTLMFLDCCINEFQNSLHKSSDDIIQNILQINENSKLNKIIERIIFLNKKGFTNLLKFLISKLGREKIKCLLENNNYNFNEIVASLNPELINYQQEHYHRDIEINNIQHNHCSTSNNLIFNKHDALSDFIKNSNSEKIVVIESEYFILSQCRVYQTLIDVYIKDHEYLIYDNKCNLDDTLKWFKNCHECKCLMMTLDKKSFNCDIEEKLINIVENQDNKIIIIITDAMKGSKKNFFKLNPFTTNFTDLNSNSQNSFFKDISRKNLEFFPKQFKDIQKNSKNKIINGKILQALIENKTTFYKSRQKEVILDALVIYLYFSEDFCKDGLVRKLLRHAKQMWGKHTLSYVNEFIGPKPIFFSTETKISQLTDEINLELLLNWKYDNIFIFILNSLGLKDICKLFPNKELLILAIKEKSEIIISNLIEKGYNIHEIGKYNMTPLHWASRMGLKSTVQQLLKKGANVGLMDDAGFTCLHLAVLYDHEDIIDILIKRNAHHYINNQISIVEYGQSIDTRNLLIKNFKCLNKVNEVK